ncbi:MAG: cbb3-type cytochrome c oxidase subunit I, partial [Nitrospirota bacterium]
MINAVSTNIGENYLTDKRGLLSWIYTLDHKRIGVMYLCIILFFFLVGGVFGLIVRLELIKPANWLMSNQTYNEMFTLHGA